MVLRGLLGLEKRREGTSFLELEFSSFADLGVGLRRLALAELFSRRNHHFCGAFFFDLSKNLKEKKRKSSSQVKDCWPHP